jgi:elongation factor G
MKTYQGSEIRNVAVVGHAHSGKTTLIAALLHAAKMTPAQGRVEDGSAVTAYDEEEVARGATMQNAVAFAEWNGVKINLVDTPGFHMFSHEARAALLPVETAVVLVNAQNGVEPLPSASGAMPTRPAFPASWSSTRWTTPRPAAAAA